MQTGQKYLKGGGSKCFFLSVAKSLKPTSNWPQTYPKIHVKGLQTGQKYLKVGGSPVTLSLII